MSSLAARRSSLRRLPDTMSIIVNINNSLVDHPLFPQGRTCHDINPAVNNLRLFGENYEKSIAPNLHFAGRTKLAVNFESNSSDSFTIRSLHKRLISTNSTWIPCSAIGDFLRNNCGPEEEIKKIFIPARRRLVIPDHFRPLVETTS